MLRHVPDPPAIRSRARALAGLVVAGVILAGCAPAEPPEALPGTHLTRDGLNGEQGYDAWPLTLDSGTLSCLEVGTGGDVRFAVVFTGEDGTQYAVNGTAQDTGRFHPFREIWARTGDGFKDTSVLIEPGLELCPSYDVLDQF